MGNNNINSVEKVLALVDSFVNSLVDIGKLYGEEGEQSGVSWEVFDIVGFKLAERLGESYAERLAKSSAHAENVGNENADNLTI